MILPTWSECSVKTQRTALEQFVYEYEPTESEQFRGLLLLALDEALAPTQRLAALVLAFVDADGATEMGRLARPLAGEPGQDDDLPSGVRRCWYCGLMTTQVDCPKCGNGAKSSVPVVLDAATSTLLVDDSRDGVHMHFVPVRDAGKCSHGVDRSKFCPQCFDETYGERDGD